jgi:5-methylcytosine-specific restriction endonuclease McrA
MGICDTREEREALAVAGHLNAAHIELVALVRHLESTGTWAVDGVRSVEHWLGWQLGLSSAEAARAVRVAAAFDTHPVLCGMFTDGRLSIAQAALAVTVDATRDAELAEVAAHCTLSQLRVFVKVMKLADTPRPAEDPEPRREFFEFGTDTDGWLNGRFGLEPEHGQLVKHALEQCRDALFHQRSADPPADPVTDREVVANPNTSPRVRWVDALAEMARRGLDGEPSELRRDRYRINLFIDLDTIIDGVDGVDGGDGPSACWITRDGVPGWLTERVLCNGNVTPTFIRDSKPVSVGRTQRIVPERTRRLVLHRDGHKCRVPWCNRTRWLDVHHIVHWADGGPTDTWNLVGVCDRCHTAIHQGYFTIEGNADDPMGLTFRDRFRRIIPLHPTPPKPGAPPPPTPVEYRHPYGERLDHSEIWVNPSRIA